MEGDDWIEAELERELLELGSVGEESDEEDDADLLPKQAVQATPPIPRPDSLEEAEAEPALPSSFKELMQCMDAWGEAVEEDVEEAFKGAQQLAEEVETELRAPPTLAWGLESLDSGPAPLSEDERRTLEGIKESVLAGKDLPEEVLADNGGPEDAEERRPDSAAQPLSSRPGSPAAPAEEEAAKEAPGSEESVVDHVIVEDIASPAAAAQAEAPSAAGVAEEERRIEAERLERIRLLELEQQEAERRFEAELARAKQLELEQQEETKRIEAERLERIRRLELEQQETLERMQREEERRREEERQYREMIAMHSEELRCKDFYDAERAFERQERRAMLYEDRRSWHARDEERKAQESEERAFEAASRAAMAREDARSMVVRRREWEKREAHDMQVEDALSKAFNEEMVRLEELRRMTLVDTEAWRWREAEREAAESSRMAAEDSLAALLRQCDPRPAARKAAARRQAPAAGAFPELPESDSAGAASEVLAALLTTPDVPEAPAKSAQPPRPLSRSGSSAAKVEPYAGPEPRRSASRAGLASPSGRRASGVAVGSPSRRSLGEANRRPGLAPELVVDPWADLSDEEAPQEVHGGASASSSPSPSASGGGAVAARRTAGSPCGAATEASATAAGGKDASRVATATAGRRPACGSALCSVLRASASRWNGHDLTTRPRPAVPVDFAGRMPQSEWTSAARDAQQEAAELVPGVELGMDCARPTDIVRLELRQENLAHIPDLSFAPNLRVLVLSGNELSEPDVLRPLQSCPHLEELAMGQNSLTSLAGLEGLSKLTVLRATMNKITDTEAIAEHRALRELELSKNRLSEVRLHAPGLAKLVLYRNSLTSASFLRHLPSLTELDLGRNMLTTVDSAISEWNPLLVKVYLYENHLTSIPQLRLPLLTDLWVNNNRLEALGPLGFLPSLERLQAKDMQIRKLASPIAASPLLQMLDLAFNQLGVAEPLHAIPHHPRLQRLQLNDNPLVEELMNGYRPWALRLAPQLVELDNDRVTEAERNVAILARAVNDPHLPHDLAIAPVASTRALPQPDVVGRAHQDSRARATNAVGLLGLTALAGHAGDGEGPDMLVQQEQASRSVGFDQADAIAVQRASLFTQWRQSCRNGQAVGGGSCDMCAVAPWCEMLTSARMALSVPFSKEEKGRQTMVDSGVMFREEVLFALRRRHEFWASFLDLCWRQYESLFPWRCGPGGVVCRSVEFEVVGAERSRQRPLRRVQARWRGVLARRAAARLRMDLRCSGLSQDHRRALVSLQARWRGAKARDSMRAEGLKLPVDLRQERCRRAATRLQAAFRSSRLRRKFCWARQMARVVDDELGELPQVDVGDILGITGDLDLANPFAALQLPELAVAPAPAPVARRQTPRRADAGAGGPMRIETAGGAAAAKQDTPSDAGAPLMAWATPPPTAGEVTGFPGISPQSNQSVGSEGLRRSRSMSSTAESATTEVEGHGRGLNRIEQAKKEWGFQDDATAEAWLAAQKHRQRRPPAIPQMRSSAGRGVGRGGGSVGGRGRGHGLGGSRSQEPAGRSASGAMVKAQDAIKAWKVQEEESGPMEFRSGEPNLKLMRSSRGLQAQLNSSPRARSPRRLVT